MTQALQLYLHLKTINNSDIPSALQVIYYALLEEGCKVTKCKKKWFRKHYIINVEDDKGNDHGLLFHLTPGKMWWECYY